MPDFIYTRVSTTRQEVLTQVVELKKLYPDAQVWKEKGSAYRGKLPLLDQLLKELNEGDRLIVYSLDRLGRRVIDLARLFDSFNRRKITLISKREGIDLSTPAGKMCAHIFSAIAQVESEIRSDRIKTAMRRLKKEGRTFGRKPGEVLTIRNIKPANQRKDGSKSRKELIEGFTETIIKLHKEGLTMRKIADIMSLRTETTISLSAVHRYIKRYRDTGQIPKQVVRSYQNKKGIPNPLKPRMGDSKRRKAT